jgi:chromosome segregation ATPase
MTHPRTALLFPRGTCKTPAFFWRGGDEFKEREHLQDELTVAKRDLTRVKQQLEKARKEFEQVQQLLNDRDGQASTLADSLTRGQSSTAEHSLLRRRVAELTIEIENIQNRISEARQHSQPRAIGRLEQERADLFWQIESREHQIWETRERIRSAQFEYFGKLSSEGWRKASDAAREYQIADRIQEQLKAFVKKAFEEQNFGDSSAQPPLRAVVEANRDLQPLQMLLHRRMALEVQLDDAKFQRCCAQIRRRVTIATLLDDIARLDSALRALGEDGFDLMELQKAHLPEGPLTPLKRPRNTLAPVKPRGDVTARSSERPNSEVTRPVSATRRV